MTYTRCRLTGRPSRRRRRPVGGKVVTVEDNYGAGFGSEVVEALMEHGGDFKVNQMYVKRIPKSGRSADDLMTYVGLSAEDIVAEVRGLGG